MTEKEFLKEMLCCTPRELLVGRLNGSLEIPSWLSGVDADDVKAALDDYDEPKFKKMRDSAINTL